MNEERFFQEFEALMKRFIKSNERGRYTVFMTVSEVEDDIIRMKYHAGYGCPLCHLDYINEIKDKVFEHNEPHIKEDDKNEEDDNETQVH